MSIQNSPSEMFVKTVESAENQSGKGLFQHFRGLLKEKILLKFLRKSEGAIASLTPLAPTTLLIDKENTNDLNSTADSCQKEHETLVKEDSVTVTIHENANDLTKALPIEENTNDLGSTVDPYQEKDETLVKENSVTVTIHENTDDQIVDEKIVGIQVHKEETDEMEMMPMT